MANPCADFTFVPLAENAPIWDRDDYFGAYAGLLAIVWVLLGFLVWGWAKMGGKANYLSIKLWVGVFVIAFLGVMFRYRMHGDSPPLPDREWPLGLAVVFWSVAGTLWMGTIRIRGFAKHSPLTVPQFMGGMLCWVLAAWLFTGLIGRPLGPLEQLFHWEARSGFAQVRGGVATPASGCREAHRMGTESHNFKEDSTCFCRYYNPCEGAQLAQQQGKLLLVMFDAHSAASVLWWEPLWFQNPSITRILNEHFIFTQLYVDEATPLPEPITLADGRRLKTQGEAHLHLQETWVSQRSQISLVLARVHGGKVEVLLTLLPLQGYSRSPDLFMEFLQQGLRAVSQSPTPFPSQ